MAAGAAPTATAAATVTAPTPAAVEQAPMPVAGGGAAGAVGGWPCARLSSLADPLALAGIPLAVGALEVRGRHQRLPFIAHI